MKHCLFVLCFAATTALIAGCAEDEPVEDQVVAEEPNKGVAYLGVDGEFTSDPLAADCPEDPRNPGRVVLGQMKTFSFYEDREGMKPLAEDCAYSYAGFAPDPHYFPEYQTSVWLQFELTSGAEGCEALHFVIMRPPHGDGAVKHMHLRYGDTTTSLAGLLDLSKGDYEDADKCDPWWSVYCTAGSEGCDN